MGVKGGHVKKFSEANMATAVDVHLNGDYHFFFDVVEVSDKQVKLHSHKNGKVFELPIQVSPKSQSEFATYEHSGVFQQMFKGKPEKVRVMPFKGERF